MRRIDGWPAWPATHHQAYKDLLEKVYKELTLLGIISFCLFIIQARPTWSERASQRVSESLGTRARARQRRRSLSVCRDVAVLAWPTHDCPARQDTGMVTDGSFIVSFECA